MLREVELSRLSGGERARWLAALAEEPLVTAATPRVDPVLSGIGALAGLVVFGVALTESADLRSGLVVLAIACACALGLAAVSLAALVDAFRSARAPVRLGRFLYPWGFAEVDAGLVRFVPGSELRHEVSVGRPRRDGTSAIAIRLEDGQGWHARFPIVGSELDAPRTGLEALATPRIGDGSYRQPAVLTFVGGRPRWRTGRHARAFAACAIAAVIGGLLPLGLRGAAMTERAEAELPARRYRAWVALARTVPLPWTRARAAREIASLEADAWARAERELRAPYREVVTRALDSDARLLDSASNCSLGPNELVPLATFARRHATGRVPNLSWTSSGADPFLDHYVSPVRRTRRGHQPVARFESTCELEPTGVREDPARSAFRLRGGWRVRDGERVVVDRRVVIEPEVVQAIAGCARSTRSPVDAELRAAATLFGRAVHRDVFVDGRGGWTYRHVLDGFEELEPCLEGALEALTVTDASAAGSASGSNSNFDFVFRKAAAHLP